MALTDDAIDKIRTMILSGRLGPGSKLPRESDLANEMGLSRNSLREAVKALELIGVLSVRRGDATYVTDLSPARLLGVLGLLADFHQPEAAEQYLDVRRAVEPAVTAAAARRMTDQQIDDLGAWLDSCSPSPEGDSLVEHELEFHRRIAEGAGNDALAAIQEAALRVCLYRTNARATWDQVVDQHRAIHRALSERDVGAARAWAIVHGSS